MKQVTIKIPDNKYAFFIELIKNLGFEKVEEHSTKTKDEVLNNIEQGFKELKLVQEGKLTSRSAKNFLDEL